MSLPTLTRRFEIDAGHRLMEHGGKCKNYHGHRYVFEVSLSAMTIGADGMIVDFGIVKDVLGGWLDEHWDHGMILQTGDPLLALLKDPGSLLRSKVYEMTDPPTAENIVRAFAVVARTILPLHDVRAQVCHVRLYETPNCWSDYIPVAG